MKQVTIDQASNHLGDLVDAAVGGEEIIVVNNGRGAVRLVPLESARPRPAFGSAKGLIALAEDFDAPLEDFREYEQ
jgi:prevent-host-death family protein